MESYLAVANTLRLDSLKQLVGEMQTCGGSCCRALLFCIYGLIVVLIFKLLGDIGRQRHIAYCIKNLVNILIFFGVVLKFYGTVAAQGDRGNGCVENIRKIKGCANLCSFAGTNECLPLTVFKHTEKQKLHITACLIGLTKQTGRNNLRRINNQHILGTKVIYNITEYFVLDITTLAVKHHKSTAVAFIAG